MTRRELVFATASSVRLEGRRLAASLVEAAASPCRGAQLVAQQASSRSAPKPYTAEEALALLVDMDLSKAKYVLMRESAKEHQCQIYPAYCRVTEAKCTCLPAMSTMSVSESCARVQLQGLLDHTASRLLELQGEVVRQLSPSSTTTVLRRVSPPATSPTRLTLLCKWGMDGSTGHSITKRGGSVPDDQLFAVTLVPLRLVTDAGDVVWSNAAPSSPRFCRPIELRHAKETAELTKATISAVGAEIAHFLHFDTLTALSSTTWP